jgi:GNAT superfamily N-acetyltransferase
MTSAAPTGDALLSHLSRLRLRFESEASLVAMDADDDPATLDWTCRAILPIWEPEDEKDTADNERLLAPDVSLSRASGDEGTELTVFSMSGLTLDLWRIGRIYESLDSRDADYEHFAGLFDKSGDMGLHPDLGDCLVTGTHVVIIDRARVAPAWRGLGGVGRLLITRHLRWAAESAAVVATHPFPIDLSLDEHEDEARVAREKAVVQRTWESLGFEPFREDIWVMQPHLRGHDDAARRLEDAFGPYLR